MTHSPWPRSWRRMRRASHEALTKRAVQNYHHIQLKEATILTSSLLSPSASLDLGKQFQRLTVSTMLSMIYDYPTLESINDPILEKVEDFFLRVSHATTPGSFYVDIFPWMKHIPERCCVYPTFRLFILTNNSTQDSPSGSRRAFNNTPRTLQCSEAFLIAFAPISYVVVLTVASGAPITHLTDQRE
jgi:hypothetical protein